MQGRGHAFSIAEFSEFRQPALVHGKKTAGHDQQPTETWHELHNSLRTLAILSLPDGKTAEECVG